MAPRKNKRGKNAAQRRVPLQNTGDNGLNANGSYWAAELAKPPPNTHKSFNSEFPALPGTSTITPIGRNDTWISPADLRDPNEWQEEGIKLNMNLDDLQWDKTPEQVRQERAAKLARNPFVDTSVPVDLKTWHDPTPPKTAEQLTKEQVEKKLIGWPWTGVPRRLITLAPFHLNEHHAEGVLSLDAVKQESIFFTKLMNIDDIAFLILKRVFEHHDTAWKLSATCQQMWHLISRKVDIWDMTGGFFNDCDKDKELRDSDRFIVGKVSAHLVVTPLRRPEGRASYLEQIRNIRGLCLSVDNFKHALQNIHFHRVTFLNINVLALLIPQMSKLEVLGVYNCHLMHLGTTLRLLDILTVDRMKGKENSVYLDFYPNYHLGPEEGGENTFGVCWDNLDFDTCMGIWSLVKRIVKKARKQGIDLESKHTMFRQWLEKTPCWAVGNTLASFRDPKKSPLEVAAMVQYRFSHGKVSYLQSLQGYRSDPSWWGRDVFCMECGQTQMGVFFAIPYARPHSVTGRMQHPQCYGCRLTFALRRETDHYKTGKRRVIKKWLREPDETTETGAVVTGIWNTTDLKKALEDYELQDLEQMAVEMDQERQHHIEALGYDKETQERQTPRGLREMNNRRGNWRRSPDVVKSKAEEKAYFAGDGSYKWHFEFHDKYDGHGHIY